MGIEVVVNEGGTGCVKYVMCVSDEVSSGFFLLDSVQGAVVFSSSSKMS